jgi:hypothetical protein
VPPLTDRGKKCGGPLQEDRTGHQTVNRGRGSNRLLNPGSARTEAEQPGRRGVGLTLRAPVAAAVQEYGVVIKVEGALESILLVMSGRSAAW